MMKYVIFVVVCTFACLSGKSNPVDRLLERIDKGASAKFKTEVKESAVDFSSWTNRGER